MTYEQTQLLAMELNRSHVGGLVQIITESWSMTGTLTRVDQHDNREWEIVYPSYGLTPSAGEICTELWIGPWVGKVIGNQPVTVERVKGTLTAPERASLTTYADGDRAVGLYVPEDSPFYKPNLRAIRQETAAPLFPEEGAVTHVSVPDEGVTRCGLDWYAGGVVLALEPNVATCPECWRHAPVNKLGGTVPEDVALGTPEARTLKGIQPGEIADLFEVPVEFLDPGVIKGDVVAELPPAPEEWPDLDDLKAGGPVPEWLVDLGGPDSVHAAIPGLDQGLCGLGGSGVRTTYQRGKVTCPECRRRLKL